jgi:hypothetical protein
MPHAHALQVKSDIFFKAKNLQSKNARSPIDIHFPASPLRGAKSQLHFAGKIESVTKLNTLRCANWKKFNRLFNLATDFPLRTEKFAFRCCKLSADELHPRCFTCIADSVHANCQSSARCMPISSSIAALLASIHPEPSLTETHIHRPIKERIAYLKCQLQSPPFIVYRSSFIVPPSP